MTFNTPLTIEQFDRMVAVGAFEKGMYRDWVELIDGVIRYMDSIGPLNETIIERLTRWSFKGPAEDATGIRIKSTVELTASNCVVLPDIAWVRRRSYWKKCTTATDVLLIIEVADSSVSYDEGKKADLDAAAGIRDYWVVNIPGQSVRVHRSPGMVSTGASRPSESGVGCIRWHSRRSSWKCRCCFRVRAGNCRLGSILGEDQSRRSARDRIRKKTNVQVAIFKSRSPLNTRSSFEVRWPQVAEIPQQTTQVSSPACPDRAAISVLQRFPIW